MESGGSDDDCSGSDGTAQREHESSDDDAHNALDSMSATGRGTVASGKSKVLSRRGLHFARIGPNARNTSNGVDSSNEEDSDACEVQQIVPRQLLDLLGVTVSTKGMPLATVQHQGDATELQRGACLWLRGP